MTKLEDIFKHQLELTHRFHAIEQERGLLIFQGPIPFDLHDIRAQVQLRLLAWDIVEETGEVVRTQMVNKSETFEELADVAHFLVELMICSGIQAYDLGKLEDCFIHRSNVPPPQIVAEFLLSLSETMYHLKAKPWRKKIKPSEIKLYQISLLGCFYAFIRMTIAYKMNADDFYQAYLGKARINHQRSS